MKGQLLTRNLRAREAIAAKEDDGAGGLGTRIVAGMVAANREANHWIEHRRPKAWKYFVSAAVHLCEAKCEPAVRKTQPYPLLQRLF
jgi:hypothetical protein